MEKQEHQKKKQSRADPIAEKGEVIITVYVESAAPNIRHQKTNACNKLKPNPPSKTSKTAKSRGYDRRAQLLAYSRGLRNADYSHAQLPTINTRPKPKKWQWKVGSRSRSQCRYERIKRVEVVDQPCLPRCFNGSDKKRNGEYASSLFTKLKSIMGELSRGCKRNKE